MEALIAIIVAVIGAAATIVAARITTKRAPGDPSPEPAPPASPPPPDRPGVPHDQPHIAPRPPVEAGLPIRLVPGHAYLVHATSFTVSFDAVVRNSFPVKASIRCIPPEGLPHKRSVSAGDRIDFSFRQKRFFFLVEKIDRRPQSMTIRIVPAP